MTAQEAAGEVPPAVNQPQPETPFEALLRACPLSERVFVLQLIDTVEVNRAIGITFSAQVDLVEEGTGGQNVPCRECFLAVLEWVYFGLLPSS